ncbi:hypothetical protein jhhlp_005443 [Lomentospora prolificans]|uniref:FAD-binding PCMH-type domain-containing protein n=1 Tax=Lomentospora prolificans TaxID=41688 RepID=A0A2N3N6Y5_9PEZI|nr:hypothetical protein jhhlp_005443 [Lomentospora prolificans]
MAESTPIPIICCGKREEVGRIVIEGLKPEIEVVHFVLAEDSAAIIIPPILAGQGPPAHPELSSIGTGNFSQVPKAVLLGGAFDDETIAKLRDAVNQTAGTRKVPWLSRDHKKNELTVFDPQYIADAAVVKPSNSEEVSEALRYATSHAIPVVVKGGGHSTSGTSASDGGLVIDLGLMNTVEVEAERKIVRVGGGALWRDVDEKCWADKLAIVGGTVNDTGVGGLTLGGGFGYLMPKYGLTLDTLIEAEVVLADGRVVTTSETENADLFWGLWGAGQNFGVVTSFVFQAHSQGDVYSGVIGLALQSLSLVVDFTNLMHERQDPDSALVWGISCSPTENEPIIVGTIFYNGSEADGAAFFKPLLDAATFSQAHSRPYPEVNTLFNDTFKRPLRALQGGTTFAPPLRKEQVEETLEIFIPLLKSNGLHRSILAYEILPNKKVREVGEEATAFAARHNIYHISTLWIWSDAATDGLVRGFNRKVINHIKETGGNSQWVTQYNNYAGDVADPRQRFGPNLERLQVLKKKYDPNNVFWKWHSFFGGGEL